MKANPYWVSCVVGGINKKTGETFLGTTDYHGTKIEADFILTGLSLYFCQVLFQTYWRADMSFEEAKELMEKAQKVMFMRDKKAIDRI